MTVSASILAEIFETDEVPEIRPRFNIAPTQVVPVLRHSPSGHREWAPCRWGLIPHWAKDHRIGAKMINARSETASSKPSFRSALAKRRCLVPTDGFFEWMKGPDGKRPFHIRFTDRRLFAFAGLWETWRPADGDAIQSFTILTTRPNQVTEPIHERMPVVLDREDWHPWLRAKPLEARTLDRMLSPYRTDEMEAVEVSRRVNSPVNDDPACLEVVTR